LDDTACTCETFVFIIKWCLSLSVGPVYKILFKFRQIGIPPGFDVNHLGKKVAANLFSWLPGFDH